MQADNHEPAWPIGPRGAEVGFALPNTKGVLRAEHGLDERAYIQRVPSPPGENVRMSDDRLRERISHNLDNWQSATPENTSGGVLLSSTASGHSSFRNGEVRVVCDCDHSLVLTTFYRGFCPSVKAFPLR